MRHESATGTRARRAQLVEDEATFRELITGALTTMDPPWVVDCQVTGGAALQVTAPVDLALVDIGLPDMSGIEVIRGLRQRHPDIPIVVISAISDERRVVEAIRAGACGYVVKHDTSLSIARVIQQVLQGVYPVSPALARHLVRLVQVLELPTGRDPDLALSPREHDLLRLFAQGLSYQEVAEKLHVSLSTVQALVRKVYGKLGAHSRHEALSEARRRGLLLRR